MFCKHLIPEIGRLPLRAESPGLRLRDGAEESLAPDSGAPTAPARPAPSLLLLISLYPPTCYARLVPLDALCVGATVRIYQLAIGTSPWSPYRTSSLLLPSASMNDTSLALLPLQLVSPNQAHRFIPEHNPAHFFAPLRCASSHGWLDRSRRLDPLVLPN